MKELLSKIPLIGSFFKNNDDWHNPDYILEVISEKELKRIRKKILKELKKEKVINPKALFYLRKYIDSSFNKKTVNIEGRYIKKQNELDQFYAIGKSTVYESISEYYDTIREIREADERLKIAIKELEPNIDRKVNDDIVYNDDTSFYDKFNKLPERLEWR